MTLQIDQLTKSPSPDAHLIQGVIEMGDILHDVGE